MVVQVRAGQRTPYFCVRVGPRVAAVVPGLRVYVGPSVGTAAVKFASPLEAGMATTRTTTVLIIVL